MQTNSRTVWTALISLVLLVSLSCKGSQQNANQQTANTGGQKLARWVNQYRSAASLKQTGVNLGFFYYSSISVVSPSVVFVAGDVPGPKGDEDRVNVILRTTDGGQNWTEKTIEQPGFVIPRLNCIHFISRELGWAVGVDPAQNGLMLKTTDGGENWTVSRIGANQIPMTIFFADAETGWMGGATPAAGDDEGTGGPSVILGTTDGGRTWQPQLNTPASIFDISFVNKTLGWASGTRGAIYHTDDGGRTWNSQRSELEYGDGPVNLASEGMKQFELLGIHFVDADHGFVAASAQDEDTGRLLATSNGGAAWRKQWIVADSGVRDVFFVSPDEGWAVTDRGQYVYHTADGGRSWLAEPKIFEQDVTMVRLGAADAQHVWAVGGGGVFFRVSD
ncbi:MAG TPA: YCF48-related protein [Blastocatellia bacterium]|nr:YCF48-related protein [Blastocatellia bacterium]